MSHSREQHGPPCRRSTSPCLPDQPCIGGPPLAPGDVVRADRAEAGPGAAPARRPPGRPAWTLAHVHAMKLLRALPVEAVVELASSHLGAFCPPASARQVIAARLSWMQEADVQALFPKIRQAAADALLRKHAHLLVDRLPCPAALGILCGTRHLVGRDLSEAPSLRTAAPLLHEAVECLEAFDLRSILPLLFQNANRRPWWRPARPGRRD